VLRLCDTTEYGGTKGRVVRMGLRNTWIKTEPGHLVVVGSSSLLGGPLTNYTATERLKKKYAFD
jgi:small-conductance mechanosensitive channel